MRRKTYQLQNIHFIPGSSLGLGLYVLIIMDALLGQLTEVDEKGGTVVIIFGIGCRISAEWSLFPQTHTSCLGAWQAKPSEKQKTKKTGQQFN